MMATGLRSAVRLSPIVVAVGIVVVLAVVKKDERPLF